MSIVVLGAGGMLGSAFTEVLAGADLRTFGREALDVASPESVLRLVAGAEVVINCAGDTDVERAEREPDRAYAANAILPGLLGTACRRSGATLAHVSSTGCYGDWKTEPYSDEDPVRPTTVHHRSKVAGELAVRESGCEHLIIRTGWLYGGVPGGPKNFVWKRLLEARSGGRMTSDAAQRGVPTYAPVVARETLAVLGTGVRGTYNLVARGAASRFDYVAEIVRSSGLSCEVEPGPAFKRLAAVSPNEAAVNYRLGLMGLDRMPDWREPLAGYVKALMASPEWRALAEGDGG